jgi:hypothetical protein
VGASILDPDRSPGPEIVAYTQVEVFTFPGQGEFVLLQNGPGDLGHGGKLSFKCLHCAAGDDYFRFRVRCGGLSGRLSGVPHRPGGNRAAVYNYSLAIGGFILVYPAVKFPGLDKGLGFVLVYLAAQGNGGEFFCFLRHFFKRL